MLRKLEHDLQALANPEKAVTLQRFFKTGHGEYGEGDKFLGITVPQQRTVAKKYSQLELSDLDRLLHNQIHEYRLTALLILIVQYKKANALEQKNIFDFYCQHLEQINNWDLVDLSAPYISGHFLFAKNKSILTTWAKDNNLWVRRIAMLSSFYFIRNNEFQDALKLAAILLHDPEDLLHKAVGWMLREIGKRDLVSEENFLRKYYQQMPRTMLRYAIEKFPEPLRQNYLKNRI